MSKWTAKYDDAQRSAVERAYCELRIRPMTKIVRMAAAGELRPEPDAEPLPPFEIPYSSAVSIAHAAERRRNGAQLRPELAAKPARDRAETLQRRLTAAIDRDLERIEKRQKRKPNEPLDAEQARRIARALRELGTLPDAHERRLPRTPGQQGPDGEQDGATRDSLAGRILAASDASMSPSVRTETLSHPQGETENGTDAGDGSNSGDSTRDEQHDEQPADDEDAGDAPGTPAREGFAGLVASGVTTG